MTTLPRDISVIIPVYNRRTMVVEAIESVMDQKGFNLEILVVDDGSTDGSDEAVDSLVKQGYPVTLQVHELNRGVSAARNTALAAATMPLIGFLDSDDLLQPGAYGSLWQLLADDLSRDIAQGCRLDVPVDSSAASGYAHAQTLPPDAIWLSGLLMKSTVAIAAGAFDESLRSGEDIAWFAHIPDVTRRLSVCQDVTIHRRIGHDNLSADVDALRRNRLAWIRERLNRADPL
jgi:glycosyltransferase involved in cell wall biosynthesis